MGVGRVRSNLSRINRLGMIIFQTDKVLTPLRQIRLLLRTLLDLGFCLAYFVILFSNVYLNEEKSTLLRRRNRVEILLSIWAFIS